MIHARFQGVQVSKRSNPERCWWVATTVCKTVQINGLRLLDEGVASVALEAPHSKSVPIFTSQKARKGDKGMYEAIDRFFVLQ